MLIAAETEIEAFVSGIFRYADEGTFVSLRAFDQYDRGRPPVLIEGIRIGRDLAPVVMAAARAAGRAANSVQPSVFAPPVATFRDAMKARSSDVANGVAISVEIDEADPQKAKATLEHLLGPVTVAVASGGEWVDPDTGEVHPKMHLHWRLSEPTRTNTDHGRLQLARRLAGLLVSADLTAAPPAHPLRWPGSWNRKGTPKLAMIAYGNPASEVHLDDALTKLEEAVEAAGHSTDEGIRASGDPQADIRRIAAALTHLSNEDLHWDQWVRVGMATYRASGGSEAGFTAWNDWSAKSKKHDADACLGRWNHFSTSPPSRIGAGTLFFMAAAEGWQKAQYHDDTPHGTAADYESSIGDPDYDGDIAHETAAKPKDDPPIFIRDEAWVEADLPMRPWVAKGYLMRRSVSVLAGVGSGGKSGISVCWGIALALGRTWSRFKPVHCCRVSLYNAEDDDNEQRLRLSAALRQFKAAPADLTRRLYRIGPSNVGTLIERDPTTRKLHLTAAMHALIAHLEAVKPDVLILDPLIAVHNADENDNTAMRSIMAAFRALAVRFNMAILLAHHVRKGSAAGAGDPDIVKGAADIVSASRVTLTLALMTEEEAEKIGIAALDRKSYFRVDGAKQNYAPLGEAEWFQRTEHELANGETVAAVVPWLRPNVWDGITSDDCNRALDEISEGPSPDSLYAPTKRGASNARWVGSVPVRLFGVSEEAAKQIIAAWIKNGLLIEVEYRDKAEGKTRIGCRVVDAKRPT